MSISKDFASPMKDAMNILGVSLHSVDVDSLHEYIHKVIQADKKAVILNLNIHCVNLALKYEWLKNYINQAQCVFCDGDGVRWGVRMLGMNPPVKITYDRWLWQLSEFCVKHDYSLYFLGAKEGIAHEAAKRLKEQYPSLKLAGTHHGYFEKKGLENDDIIDRINRSGAQILVVGFGMPIQEQWIKENADRLSANVFLAAGAGFECISGHLSKPPQWMIRFQMEWLYRFYEQPRQRFVRYFVGIPKFFINILLQLIRGNSSKR